MRGLGAEVTSEWCLVVREGAAEAIAAVVAAAEQNQRALINFFLNQALSFLIYFRYDSGG